MNIGLGLYFTQYSFTTSQPLLRKKVSAKFHFQVGMDLKKEDYLIRAKNNHQMSGSLLAFFHLCLVPVLFSDLQVK